MLKSIKLQETSLLANDQNKTSGNKKIQLEKLKELYASNPQGLTDVEASDILKIPPAIVSARRNDLMEFCNVAQISKRKNKSGASAIVWTILESASLFGRKQTPKQRLNEIITIAEKWKQNGNAVSAPTVIETIIRIAKA